MGDTSFEELEEEEHFWDPNLLLPDNLTREQLYAEHVASLRAVEMDFGHYIGNGQMDSGIHDHFPSQASTSAYANHSQHQHIFNGAPVDGNMNREYASLHAFGYSLGGPPHTDPPDCTDGLKLMATSLLDPSLASLTKGKHVDLINISHLDELVGVTVKDEDDLDFNEWLHDHDETTDESKEAITIEGNQQKDKLT
jgi:hypothetical protein